MTRSDFTQFVEQTLENILRLAEERSGRPLPRRVAFQWMTRELIRENIVEEIVARVFVDDEHIYPCVDIGVGDLLQDGTPLIVANVAGYPPGPFGKNWTGTDGPFIHIIGGSFLARLQGLPVKDSQVFGFIIPGMKDSKTP